MLYVQTILDATYKVAVSQLKTSNKRNCVESAIFASKMQWHASESHSKYSAKVQVPHLY